MRALLLAVILSLAPPSALAQASKPLKAGSVVHVTVSGDLETMQAAKELRSLLLDAQRDRCALVVLELGGDESRLDVVHEMARAIHETRTPVVAYLQDPDGVVGAGALALGLVGQDCILGPQVTIKGRAAGVQQAPLAPDDANFETDLEDLARWMGLRARDRGLPESFETAVLSPSRTLWALVNGREATAAWERPRDGEVIPVVIEQDGHHLVSLTAKDAVRLKYATGTLETWPLILNRWDLKNAPRVERVIGAAVGAKSMRAELLLSAIDKAHDVAKEALKLPWPAAKDLAASKYHEAATLASRLLKEANMSVAELEKLLEAYPEVMRRPAPGQTSVAGKPSTFASKWRTLVQQRKDRIKKLEETAKKFATA
jgi:hypothetical protein